MTTTRPPLPPTAAEPKSPYTTQRELLLLEIAQSLNAALHNLNALNRSIEEVIQVGNEFAPVESLWSYFEGVMGGQREQGQSQEEQEQSAEKEGGEEGGEEEGEEGE